MLGFHDIEVLMTMRTSNVARHLEEWGGEGNSQNRALWSVGGGHRMQVVQTGSEG